LDNFWVLPDTFPAGQKVSPIAAKERAVEDTKDTLLIVDDDLDLVDMLTHYFSAQDYTVLTANSGEEAFQACEAQRPNLVVLDIHLPDMDGFQVYRNLQQQRHTQQIPVLFLTERNERQDKLQGLELGVVDYITKPFDVQELRLRVRNAITRASRQTSLNPVTDLPEHETMDEKLESLRYSDAEWALVAVALNGMNVFREHYGFVSADDVMRAVTLMIRNGVKEYGNPEDFIGHLNADTFLIVTTADKAKVLRDKLTKRIRGSTEYFYPLRDRTSTHQKPDVEYIFIKGGLLTKDAYADVPTMRSTLASQLS
jgi:DNA-binding response OmpR family regulator